VQMLGRMINVSRPDVLLTYDADGGYGHPDHVAVHQVAVAAAAQAGWPTPRVLAVIRPRTVTTAAFDAFPVPRGCLRAAAGDVWSLSDDSVVAVAVPVAGVERARRRALAAHATQVTLIPGGFALSNRIAQPLPDTEYYRLLAGDPPPRRPDGSPADDVFAGLS